ncbi:MAG: O-antigen ligase family protein [Planctomycetota bacterium]|jgi:O-antigen ligase
MDGERSLDVFFETFLYQVGPLGIVAALTLSAIVLLVLVVWRSAQVYLACTFFPLAAMATGMGREWATPVLPDAVTTFCSSVRWFPLILAALIGFAYVLLGRVRLNQPFVLLFILCGLALCSAVLGVQDPTAFHRAIGLLLVVGAGFLFYHVMTKPDGSRRYMQAMFWVSVIFIVGLLLSVVLRPHLVYLHGRFRGFLSNANMLGFVAFTLVVPMAWKWLDPQSTYRAKSIGVLGVAFWGVVILAAGSRAGMLGALPIGLGIIILRGMKLTFWIPAAILVGAVVYVGSAFMESESREHLLSTDVSSRIAHAQFGFEVISESPVIGHGFGYSALEARVPWTGQWIHNGYIGLLIDVGIVGLALVLWASLATLWAAWRAYRECARLGYSRVVPILLLSLFCSFLANAAFEGWLTGIGSFQLFAFIATLSAIMGMQHRLQGDLLGRCSTADRECGRRRGLLLPG